MMLSAEAAGEIYSKTEHRRALLTKLDPSRSPQAVEFKHSNISAAMIELGLPYIRGYKPRGNYQAALAAEIQRRLTEPKVLAGLRATPLTSPTGNLSQTEIPPTPPRERGGRHIDYGSLQEENRRLGALGEELVVAFERQWLRHNGHPGLADAVRWVAREDGDGLGYDILSFSQDGRERHIEVKSTALGAQTPFYISSAELEFARCHPQSFELYRVYDVLSSPHFYVLEGDITTAVDLVPTAYRAQVKPRARQLGGHLHQPASTMGVANEADAEPQAI